MLPPGLYPSVLGDAWLRLDPAVRRLHEFDGTLRADGVFQVRKGSNWLTRLMARLAGMPAPGDNVAVQLVVVATDAGEEWQRSFVGKPLLSVQSKGTNGLLIERIGRTEMGLRLTVVDGALHYQTVNAALRLGRLRIPLLRGLYPKVTALETAGDGGHIQVLIEVNFPVLGRLISYGGKLTLVEAKP